MNTFDTAIETFLTQLHLSTLSSAGIRFVADSYTFKGLVLIPLLWWIWFRPGADREWRREMVIAAIFSGLLALSVGRILAHFLPFRVRPLYEQNLHLQFPSIPQHESLLSAWSSFPSDHAMLWAAVSVGIFIVSRRLGVLALSYTVIFICAPRAYLGFHYPTDLLAGAAIGILITYLMTRNSVRNLYAPRVLRWIESYPGQSAAVGFVLCLEIVTQFDELRSFANAIFRNM
ncbi:PA-phosphatase like phosphoesterase [Caballeronia choica]|uniref:PA-phosphatase like phosphoesterase n=1 Tax=Caballeronia choica TaxID=326476 RepID=A0A158KTV1_9BURK|nr:phosphatase PAP2 family protein [Caballeronia choica]SAL84514.1 PA-phosphatase like phosphoesterase [Caballeronia choica]